MIDRTRDQARYRRILAENVRERVGKGWRGLNGHEVVFANVVAEAQGGRYVHLCLHFGRSDSPLGKTKRRLALTLGRSTSDPHDIPVECSAHIIEIAKDERLFKLESTSDDILGVLIRKLVSLFDLEVGFHEEFLVVGQLNDERAIKDVLKPLREHERDLMTNVHRSGRRSTARVEVEWLTSLVAIEDERQVSV